MMAAQDRDVDFQSVEIKSPDRDIVKIETRRDFRPRV